MTRAPGLLVLACVAAHAQQSIKLPDLIQQALRSNPELAAAQKRVEAARQKPKVEGALPDPMVTVGYASVGNPLPGAGIGREPLANAGVMVTQELMYPGKRRLMANIAEKEAGAELESFHAAERAIVAKLKIAFHKLNHAYEALDVMRHSQELLVRFIKLAEVRYSVGKAMQQDIFKAQSQLAIMETRIVKMQQDLAMAEAEINAVLHQRIDRALPRPEHDAPRSIAPTLAQLVAAAEQDSPNITREQRMTEARQLEVSLARKNFKPDFAVSGGYYNMGTMPSMYEFRLDIKLPVRREKNQAALANKVHTLEQSRRTYEAMLHETRWRVNELYITAQTSWRLMQLYADSIMPQAELTVESSLASYESGSLESMQVLMNLMSRVEQEERYHEEMLNYFTAVIRLEEITGKELL